MKTKKVYIIKEDWGLFGGTVIEAHKTLKGAQKRALDLANELVLNKYGKYFIKSIEDERIRIDYVPDEFRDLYIISYPDEKEFKRSDLAMYYRIEEIDFMR